MKESCVGKERVKVPSPSSVTVIWLVVPAIQEVSSGVALEAYMKSLQPPHQLSKPLLVQCNVVIL